jgi:1-deoxy-D-xylulose-5-phosphate reductoisomerase
MGAKITIDSATLMNKGLELIEAHHLYGLPLDAIDVLVHKESIIHSLVEFADGSQLAQLGQPDMRIPISHCLGWPRRIPTGVPRLDLASLRTLSFARPDEEEFPCLAMARRAQERGRGSPVALNAANEEAVAAFLARRIGFLDIAAIVGDVLTEYASGLWTGFAPDREPESMDAILALDAEARMHAAAAIGRRSRHRL